MEKWRAKAIAVLIAGVSVGDIAAQSVTLDYIDDLAGTKQLVAGKTNTLYFRLQNPSANYYNTVNSFGVYSPNGATWDIVGATQGELPPGTYFGLLSTCFSCTGTGIDTLRLVGLAVLGARGLPAGFDGIGLTLSLEISLADVGKTVCVDSIFSDRVGGAGWLWFTGDTPSIEDVPSWSGPYCFEIVREADVQVPFDSVEITVLSPAAVQIFENDSLVLSNIDPSGNAGVRLTFNEATTRNGVSLDFGRLNLGSVNTGVSFTAQGFISNGAESSEVGRQQQLLFRVGLQNSFGDILVEADFTPLGNPNILFEVYDSSLVLVEAAIVAGGGVVAIGHPLVDSLSVLSLKVSVEFCKPLRVAITLDQDVQFDIIAGPTPVGNSMHVVSENAQLQVLALTSLEITAQNMQSLSVTGVQAPGPCCYGIVGNVDGDYLENVDIRDLVRLIEYLYISFTSPYCCDEANVDNDADRNIDVRDLVALINSLYITFDPLPSCP